MKFTRLVSFFAAALVTAVPIHSSFAAGLDAALSGYDYPYAVNYLPVQTATAPDASNGKPQAAQTLQMAYMDVGPRDAARTVLLLHGKNFSGAYWQTTIEALVDQGHRVIAPDQIGFGKSSKPLHFPWTFDQLATYTGLLLDQLKVQNVAVVGHSMGGMLAARFTLMNPERVDRLVLVNPIGLEDWRRKVPYQPMAEIYLNELKKQPGDIKTYMQKAYFGGDWKEAYLPLVELQKGWVAGPDWPTMAWISAQHYDMIFTQPVLYDLPEIRTSTLLIIGQRDRTALGKNRVSDEVAATLGRYALLGKEANRLLPNSTLIELNNVGHIPQFEAFDEYIAALQKFIR